MAAFLPGEVAVVRWLGTVVPTEHVSVVFGTRVPERMCLCGRYHDRLLGDSLGSCCLPLVLAWEGAAETLTWAERGRLVREQSTPCQLYPKTDPRRSAPDRIGPGAGREERMFGRVCGFGFAWRQLERCT